MQFFCKTDLHNVSKAPTSAVLFLRLKKKQLLAVAHKSCVYMRHLEIARCIQKGTWTIFYDCYLCKYREKKETTEIEGAYKYVHMLSKKLFEYFFKCKKE